METNKEFLGWKIGPNNFRRKVGITGIVGKKNSGLENQHEKLVRQLRGGGRLE